LYNRKKTVGIYSLHIQAFEAFENRKLKGPVANKAAIDDQA